MKNLAEARETLDLPRRRLMHDVSRGVYTIRRVSRSAGAPDQYFYDDISQRVAAALLKAGYPCLRTPKLMYHLQDIPDATAFLKVNGAAVTPLATLKDERGSVCHIVEDDRCYLLLVGNDRGGYVATRHWFAEAVEALKTLPALPV